MVIVAAIAIEAGIVISYCNPDSIFMGVWSVRLLRVFQYIHLYTMSQWKSLLFFILYTFHEFMYLVSLDSIIIPHLKPRAGEQYPIWYSYSSFKACAGGETIPNEVKTSLTESSSPRSLAVAPARFLGLFEDDNEGKVRESVPILSKGPIPKLIPGKLLFLLSGSIAALPVSRKLKASRNALPSALISF